MYRPDAIHTIIATDTMSTTTLHESLQEAVLLEAAAGMHTGQEVVPAKAPVLHRELLLIDEVLQLQSTSRTSTSRR